MIDDQPEVSIDDPAFLYENNEGFQEVMSKKNLQKIKQKLLPEEPIITQAQKKSHDGSSKEKRDKKEHGKVINSNQTFPAPSIINGMRTNVPCTVTKHRISRGYSGC